MDKTDATKIWKHFQRFADYSDLKDLYTKCIPELAKFEQRIIDFQREIDRNAEIMRRFDEVIGQKSNKQSVKKVYEYIATNCATPEQFKIMREKMD